MREYIGVLHIHSTFSDGSGETDEIANIADEVGLDFIVLTDHNTLRAYNEGFEGWYGSTLLLVGCEINDRENKNHLLALNIDEAYSTRLSAKEYVKKVKDSGGIGILAHPHEKRKHMKEHPPYPWIEWDTDDFQGIEIWNHMSEWMENLTEQNKYQAFLHPLRTIKAPPKETLDLWDKIIQQRPVTAIGGVDAHAHKYNLLGFLEVEIFPYKVLFKSIRTHILTDKEIKKGKGERSLNTAKKIIYDAILRGNCFVANDYHGDSTGFNFFALSGKKAVKMGETIKHAKDIKLKIISPRQAEIKLLKDGKIIKEAEGSSLDFDAAEKGAYRAEVYLSGKAWIFSNHIRIGI
jgi:hypothetical protein